MGPQNNRAQKPKEIYKVDWMGKDNSFLYSKTFTNYSDAIAFSKTVKFALVFKKAKESKDTLQWTLVPTKNARELVKGIKLRKALDTKNPFYNADGVSEIEVASTAQVKASQNVRLINMFVFTPVLIYAGTRKELPTWLRYSLFGIAGLNFLSNLKNYTTNSKIEKSLQEADEATDE